jgi:hypothetical protein
MERARTVLTPRDRLGRPPHVYLRHILPNILSVLIVQFTRRAQLIAATHSANFSAGV